MVCLTASTFVAISMTLEQAQHAIWKHFVSRNEWRFDDGETIDDAEDFEYEPLPTKSDWTGWQARSADLYFICEIDVLGSDVLDAKLASIPTLEADLSHWKTVVDYWYKHWYKQATRATPQ